MHLRTYYPTVVLSDIHLGTSHSKTIEVSNFLKSVNCDRLILNGDIIDGWHLRKAGTKKWQAKHTDFFKVTPFSSLSVPSVCWNVELKL